MNRDLGRSIYGRADGVAMDPYPILQVLQSEPEANRWLQEGEEEKLASLAQRAGLGTVEELHNYLQWIHQLKEDTKGFARSVATVGPPPHMSYLSWFSLVLHESTIRWLRIDDMIQASRIALTNSGPLAYYQALLGENEGTKAYVNQRLEHMMQ